ncbi:MAG: CARDB domain-containing protein, partial [Candidatus Thermoplasmatota archaeon]|nr:CARDB domain-containing protein [Candidatus Thermoplasmatota archaeon]
VAGGTDLAGNLMLPANQASFVTIDTTPPTLVSAEITSKTSMTLTFSEPVAPASVTAGLFTLSNGQITGVLVIGENVTLTISGVPMDEALILGILGGVKDPHENEIAPVVGFPVADKAPPVMLSARTSLGGIITITWSEDIDTTSLDNNTFQITSASPLSITAISSTARTTTLELSRLLADNETPVVMLVGTVSDLSGNQALPHQVTSQDGIAPRVSSVTTISTTQIRVLFTEPILPMSKDRFAVENSAIKTLTHSGNVVTLTLETSFLPYETPLVTVYAGILDQSNNPGVQASITAVDGIPNVAPVLLNPFASANRIYQNEPVVLSVVYRDHDNDAPATITARLVGASTTNHPMTWSPGNYVDGIVASVSLANLQPGTYVISFIASDGTTQTTLSGSLSLVVLEVEYRNLTLSSNTVQLSIDPANQRTGTVSFTIRNTGNVAFEAYLNTSLPTTWDVSLTPTYNLAEDGTATLTLGFTVPANIVRGTYDHSLSANPVRGGNGDTLQFSVRIIRGEASEPTLAVSSSKVGREATITITLGNQGDGVLKDALLYLYDNGNPIGYIDIPSLAPGMEHQINLAWTPATPGAHTITAEVVAGDERFIATETVQTADYDFGEMLFGEQTAPAFMLALFLTSIFWALVLGVVIYRHRKKMGKAERKEDAL